MDNDNPFESDLPPGRSVFGDDDLPTGASVFGDVDGDIEEAVQTSVFGDADSNFPVDEIPVEAIERPSASVFADVASDADSASVIDESPVLRTASIDDWSTAADADGDSTYDVEIDIADEASEVIDEVEIPDDPTIQAPIADAAAINLVTGSADIESEPEIDGVGDDDLDAVPLDDGSDDPIDLLGDPITEVPEEIDPPTPSTTTSFNDDITTGEAIALDVEPGDEDGLDAWADLGTSDLGNTAPAWGDADETAAIDDGQTWSPGPIPEPESAVVKVGGESERFFEFDEEAPENSPIMPEETVSAASEMQSRVITGVALLAIAVVGFTYGGPLVALALITIVVALAAGEFYNALRVAGYNPATLLGLAATISMPIAVYFRGTEAVALVMALAIVFGLIWYLAGVATEMPVMNLGVTLLGVAYIGVLGSFGAALLETGQRIDLNGDGSENGTGFLLAAVILTVGYDVGAFFSGRSMGRTPLTKVSPKKTVEGLIGGAVMTVVVSVVFLSVLNIIEPFSTFGSPLDAFILGVLAAIMAPLGDLGESLIKRDLGIKDMGTILPGHGGFLDRFDALLFVLPTVYFFSLIFFYGG